MSVCKLTYIRFVEGGLSSVLAGPVPDDSPVNHRLEKFYVCIYH